MATLYPSFFTAPIARLDQGLAAHREGRLNEAEIHYRAVLQAEPDHPEALHYLGVIAHQTGGHDQAIALISRSLQLRPDANATNSLGEALRAVGRLTEALAAYEATLMRDPNHPAALGNCGLALRQLGRPAEAERALARAIPITPHWLDLHRHLGELRAARGDIEGALAAFEGGLAQNPGNGEFLALSAQTLILLGHLEVALTRLDAAIARLPDRADLHYDRGVLLRRLQRIPEATHAYARAVELKPDHADALMNWGNALQEAGALEESLAIYERALSAAPQSAPVRVNLCQLLLRIERVDDSVLVGEAAVALDPRLLEAHLNLGNAYHTRNRIEDSAASYRRALEIQPDRIDIISNLASALAAMDADEEAFALFDRIIDERQDMPEFFVNRGKAYAERRMVEEAEADYRRAVALGPDLAVAHANLGVTRLLRGDFEEGWREFEWRWRTPGFAKLESRFEAPLWRGEDLTGKTILLHNEQGFGDTLQFCRLAAVIQAMGAKVILQVQRPLASLLSRLEGVDQLIPEGDPLPPHDLRCPLLTAPGRLKLDLSNIPAKIPYLHADPTAVTAWSLRLAAHGEGLKVGLVWAASPDNPVDRRRSTTLERLAPLGRIPGVKLFAIQKGVAAEQARNLPEALSGLISLSDQLEDFSDTAAVIANLDLVISVCSSPAHLAAGLGKPVWLLDRFDGDWRWLLDRDDTPWYPNLKIYRQPDRGDWDAPIARIAADLATLAASTRPPARKRRG